MQTSSRYTAEFNALIDAYTAAYEAYERIWDAHCAWTAPRNASIVPFPRAADMHEYVESQSPFRAAKNAAYQAYEQIEQAMTRHPEYTAPSVRYDIKEDWQ